MDLIDHIKSGDTEACEALFQTHKNMVYKIAYLMTGSSEEAEDVVQEVFIKAFRKAATFQPERGSVEAWLHGITVNQCNSGHRKNCPTTPLDGIVLKATDPDALLKVVIEEERQEVWQALKSLDEGFRLVLVLRYYEELSYEEIAARAGIPLGTVRSRISRGLNHLRKVIKQKGVKP